MSEKKQLPMNTDVEFHKNAPEEHNLENDKTEVFDEADIANQYALDFANNAWKNHQLKQVKKTHPDFDGVHCFECGDPLHKVRIDMGVDKCTECQQLEEDIEKKKNNRR